MQKEHFEVLLEDIKGKFDLVLEGNSNILQEIRKTREVLSGKIENNSFLLKTLSNKLDGIAS